MNNRTEKRIPLLTPWLVLDRKDDRPIGYVGDVSPHGVMVIVQEEMGADETLDIRIRVPNQNISFDATVKTRWCDVNVNPELHCIGCCFVEVDEAQLKRMLELAEAQEVDGSIALHRVGG